MKHIPVADLRRTLASVIEEVRRTGEPVTVTQRGVEAVRIVPTEEKPTGVDLEAIAERFKGRIRVVDPDDDFTAPLYGPDEWKAWEAKWDRLLSRDDEPASG